MTRAVIAALAAAAMLPALASAQYGTVDDGALWGERVRVTPWAGVTPRMSRSEHWRVVLDGQEHQYDLDTDLGPGPVAGGEIEFRLYERFSLLGAGAFVNRGETVESDPTTGARYTRSGSDFIVAKLGVAVRLREAVSDMQLRQVTATVFAAPAFIREMPGDDPFAVDEAAMNMLGANFGLNAEIPFGFRRLAFQIGLEDFVVFWDNTELARRTDAFFADTGLLTRSTVNTDASHMLLLRAGLTFRFH